MLLASLALYFYAPVAPGATRTFDVPTLLAAAQHFSDPLKVWLFWGFFFAFAIKVPDRKSTRLNSSHVAISYAVFCLKKTNEASPPLILRITACISSSQISRCSI